MDISSFILLNSICILIGMLLDLLIGDPIGFPHVVIMIGKLISFLEKRLYKNTDSDEQKEKSGKIYSTKNAGQHSNREIEMLTSV